MDRITEQDGPRGGEYFVAYLSDGRAVAVSRKPGDDRVWLGRRDEPGSYQGQRGGIGTLERFLDDLRARLATGSDEDRELYHAAADLKRRKDGGEGVPATGG
jgi:hypothetical protein